MDHPPATLGPQAVRTSPLAWIALALTFVSVLPLGLVLGILDSVLDLVCTLAGASLAVVAAWRYGFSISGEGPYEVSCWAVSDESVTGTMRATHP